MSARRGLSGRRRVSVDATEDEFQVALVDLLLANGLLPVHVVNQGKRSRRMGAALKRMGLYEGFPDLEIFDRRGGRGLLCLVEAKRPPRRLSSGSPSAAAPRIPKAQRDAHEDLRARGAPVFIWRSLEQAAADLSTLGVVLRARPT